MKYSIPAILAINAKYVSNPGEGTFNVSNATEATTTVLNHIYSGNLSDKKFSVLNNDDYFKLYHLKGWVSYCIYSDKYYFGATETEPASEDALPHNETVTTTAKCLYFVNGAGITDLTYCIYDEYVLQQVDLYFKIESYNTQLHVWNVFVIESLLPQVY